MSPAPKDYVDVAERIRQFKLEYPDGSLQSHEAPRLMQVDQRTFIVYCAAAYRTPDDQRPGIGWAWEPVPGPTPFTRDSELMNAETSAWGRAIVALGFETKHIASSNEVRNRQASSEPEKTSSDAGRHGDDGRESNEVSAPPRSGSGSEGSSGSTAAEDTPITPGLIDQIRMVLELLDTGFPEHPGEGRTWADVLREHRLMLWPDKPDMRQLSVAQGNQLVDWLEDQHRMAVQDAQVPFG